MKRNLAHIAIVRLSALGDIINSAVVLQFIKKHYPDMQIDWFCEEVFAPILYEHPFIDTVYTLNLKKIKKSKNLSSLLQTIRMLKNTPDYDLVIDMQGLLKSAIVSSLVGKNRHGFDTHSTRESIASFFYTSTSHMSYESNVVRRNCFVVADALDFIITDDMLLNKDAVFPKNFHFELPNDKRKIAFVIGASWPSKIYPKEKVAAICEALEENAYIIWGTEKEQEDAKWIVQNSKYAHLAPKLSLNELVSFISEMDLLIGNDTGPTHIAWAQNIPSITLLGPTTTRMIYETPKNIGIKSPSEVNILKINKNDFSIQEIDYNDVAAQAKELLQ